MSELILVVSDSTLTPMSDIGASVAECKKEDSEETLEVGGRGKIIANFGLRIANLKARKQETGDRGQRTARRRWRLEERRFGRLRP